MIDFYIMLICIILTLISQCNSNFSYLDNKENFNKSNDKVYRCNTYNYNKGLSKGSCNKVLIDSYEYNTYIHEVNTCEYYETCDYLSTSTASSNCIEKSEEIPGEYCYYDRNCKSNICLNFICQGKTLNANCLTHYDCNNGLVCLEGKCSLPLKSGSKCSEDYECENNNGCLNDVCTPYYSLKANSPTSSYLFCESVISINQICREVMLINSKDDIRRREDFECKEENINEGCRYSIIGTSDYFTTECVCSFGDKTKKYCQRDSFGDFRDLGKKLFMSIDMKTHTLKRYSKRQISPSDLRKLEFPKLNNIESDDLIELILQNQKLSISALILVLLLIMLIS